MSLPHSLILQAIFGQGGGGTGSALLEAGWTEVVADTIYETQVAGTGSADFGGANIEVHVIGAGGWSGRDGMGYGNCGGGGGGGGARATINGAGVISYQVGTGIAESSYDDGQDGALSEQETFAYATPGTSQTTWFNSSTFLYGNGGGPGFYNGNANNSGVGGTWGGTAATNGSNGGNGGGAVWNGEGNGVSTRGGPTSSTFGGGGGGEGNSLSPGASSYGANGALSGTGGRGGIPNGNSFPASWRENTAGTKGGGNGGQSKWFPDNTAPAADRTVIGSTNGVIRVTIL
jgi:hypothetical protein